MKVIVLTILNAGLLVLFFILLRRPNLLTYHQGGKIWLTYLAIGIITLMDEFTSIFYVPAEAYRFIGLNAIAFIAVTSILVRLISTRLTEIAEILEHHHLIGGGVYSFSYLVSGLIVSFIAMSSIMVDYILTACISAVSAVANATSFFPLEPSVTIALMLSIIWAVTGLNIMGIRENARFTFMIFIGAAFVMLNLIVSGFLSLDADNFAQLRLSATQTVTTVTTGSIQHNYGNFISSIAFCILAYSGVESVLQTAGFVRSWKEIRKAYWFLALTVGLVTPRITALVLSSKIDFRVHEGDLITYYATMLNGVPFGIAVGTLASFTLTLAVNTAFVASSELMERAAHRYGFHWLIAVNKRHSLYRIHLCNATFFTMIIFLTMGSQAELANMYALGLIASFCINMGCLILYRYFKGRSNGATYSTSRFGTIILFVILVSCFVFLAIDKPNATMLWATVTGIILILGSLIAKKRSPELKQIEQGETDMDVLLFLAESDEKEAPLFLRRSDETDREHLKRNEAYVTFYSPRVGGIPPKMTPNHFRIPLTKIGLFHRIVAHLGWPMSSWFERLSIGAMIYNLMKLPRVFPNFDFDIEYHRRSSIFQGKNAQAEAPYESISS